MNKALIWKTKAEALEAALEVEREARREQAMDLLAAHGQAQEALERAVQAEAERDWWQERVEGLEASNAELAEWYGWASVRAERAEDAAYDLEATLAEARIEGARLMQEAAASVAQNACLVPPDGGSPTPAEEGVCRAAADYIRALDPAKIVQAPAPASGECKSEGEA